jgi:hypothetical protein
MSGNIQLLSSLRIAQNSQYNQSMSKGELFLSSLFSLLSSLVVLSALLSALQLDLIRSHKASLFEHNPKQ